MERQGHSLSHGRCFRCYVHVPHAQGEEVHMVSELVFSVDSGMATFVTTVMPVLTCCHDKVHPLHGLPACRRLCMHAYSHSYAVPHTVVLPQVLKISSPRVPSTSPSSSCSDKQPCWSIGTASLQRCCQRRRRSARSRCSSWCRRPQRRGLPWSATCERLSKRWHKVGGEALCAQLYVSGWHAA